MKLTVIASMAVLATISLRTIWLLFRGMEWPVRKRAISLLITLALVVLFNELLQRTL